MSNDRIKQAEVDKKKTLEKLAELFTSWRVGDFLTLSRYKKEKRFLVFDLTMYSDFHLKEEIYDGQFVVKAELLEVTKEKSKAFLFTTVLLYYNGEIADPENVKLIKHESKQK